MYENIVTIERTSQESLQTQIRRQMAIAISGAQIPDSSPLAINPQTCGGSAGQRHNGDPGL